MDEDEVLGSEASAAEGERAAGRNELHQLMKEALREPLPMSQALIASVLMPRNLGPSSDADGMGLSLLDLQRYADAHGISTSDEFRAAVQEELAEQAARLRARKRAPGAGRPGKIKTQYDIWNERRKGLRHRLKLQKLGLESSWLNDCTYLRVLMEVVLDPAIPKHRKTAVTLSRLARRGSRAPEQRSVRRHIEAIENIRTSHQT